MLYCLHYNIQFLNGILMRSDGYQEVGERRGRRQMPWRVDLHEVGKYQSKCQRHHQTPYKEQECVVH